MYSQGKLTESLLQNLGGETMKKEEKADFDDVYSDLKKLSRDDLMKTYGFALGLKAKGGYSANDANSPQKAPG